MTSDFNNNYKNLFLSWTSFFSSFYDKDVIMVLELREHLKNKDRLYKEWLKRERKIRMRIKIVTDSTVDLPQEVLDQYEIEIVPLSITIDGVSYLDRVELTPSEFMSKLKAAKEIPKSSQPAVGSFVEVYDRLGQDGSHIISIHMTEGMSGTYASAKSASDLTSSTVTVINSSFISVALGFQVLEAAKMAQNNHSVDEIIQRLESIKNNTSLYIMVDTLEYLVKGGRVGKATAFIGSLLNIKPISSLTDGVLSPVTKVRTHAQMITFLTQRFKAEIEGKVVKGIGIAQVEAEGLANQLKEKLVGLCDVKDILIIETTPVISTHTGPGAIALMYYVE